MGIVVDWELRQDSRQNFQNREFPCQKTCQIAASSSVGITDVKPSGLGNSDRSVIKLTKSPSFISNTSQNFMNTALPFLPLPSALSLYIPFFFVFPFSPM